METECKPGAVKTGALRVVMLNSAAARLQTVADDLKRCGSPAMAMRVRAMANELVEACKRAEKELGT